jgi:hypothetical protein
MSDDSDKRSGAHGDGIPDEPEKDVDAIRALLKRSVAKEAPEPPPDIVRKVQRRIRQRSKGKFFADGWSTTQSRVNYALVALMMLLLIAVVYFALGPMGVSPH